jgi:hypothetical protein
MSPLATRLVKCVLCLPTGLPYSRWERRQGPLRGVSIWTECRLGQGSALARTLTMLRGFILSSVGQTSLAAYHAQIMPSQVSCVFSITSGLLCWKAFQADLCKVVTFCHFYEKKAPLRGGALPHQNLTGQVKTNGQELARCDF